MIKSYKLFLESTDTDKIVKDKLAYICKSWWTYNRHHTGIAILNSFFEWSGISQSGISNLDDLTIHVINTVLPMLKYSDENSVMSNLINNTYNETQRLEKEYTLPTVEQIKDHMLHIVDMLDEYHTRHQFNIQKYWGGKDFILNGEFSTTVYLGESPNISLDVEKSEELTSKVLKELEFTKDSIESDFPKFNFTFHKSDDYYGIDFKIKRKK